MDDASTEPLFNRLVHYVESGFALGDKLPGERELAELFGVSRNQLREELSRLEAYRIVQLKPKARAVVIKGAPSLDRIAQFSEMGVPIDNRQALQAIEVRRITEVAAVRLACERVSDENLESIAAVLARCDAKLAEGQPIHAEDEEFHLELIRATQNEILLGTLASFYAMTRARREHYFGSQQRAEQSHRDHMALFELIRARDADQAAAFMNNHIERAGSFWSGDREDACH